MSLFEQIAEDIKTAMRARDTTRLGVLRMLKSALQNAAIEKGTSELQDADAIAVIRKQIKQRQDSIEGFEKGGRAELAESERQEIAILERYLPAMMTPEEVTTIVSACIKETGASSRKEMGAVMKEASARTAGRVDGKTLSAEVARQLS
jgi:uncharacterized protein